MWTTIAGGHRRAARRSRPSPLGISLWVTLRRWILEPLDALGHRRARGRRRATCGTRSTAVGPGEIAALAGDVERDARGARRPARRCWRPRAPRSSWPTSSSPSRPRSCAARTGTSSSSPTSRRTTCRSRCARSRASPSCCRSATAGRWTSAPTSTSRSRSTAPSACSGSSRTCSGFSRVGRVGGEVTDVDLGARARGRARQPRARRSRSRGAVVTHDELPVVRGEEPLLVQLFQNLVGNAVKFRDPDRAADGPPQRAARGRLLGARVPRQRHRHRRAVRGAGVRDLPAAARQGRVRGHRHRPGSLCKKIVEFHGGRIWIEQPDGEGTSIRWTLPAADDRRLNGGAPCPTSTKIIDVLLVEDDPGDVLMTREAFEDNKVAQPPVGRLRRGERAGVPAQGGRARRRPDARPHPARPQPAADGRPRGPAGAQGRRRTCARSRSSC